MLQPKELKKGPPGMDPAQEYRGAIRKELKVMCDVLDIPTLYQPGVINTPDLSMAMMGLGLFEVITRVGNVVEDLRKEVEDLRKLVILMGKKKAPAKKKAAVEL